jgi:DNA-binding MarR family transcriptional regulator
MDDRKGRWPKLRRRLIERKIAKRDLRRAVVSISESGLKLMEVVAPSSEAIHAEIRRCYGAKKLAELQEMLGALEASLEELDVAVAGPAQQNQ